MIEQLINGLTLGSQIALIAAGLALLFGVLEIVNFAHGELYMLGAYLLYMCETLWDLPYLVAVLVTVIGMMAFGALFYAAVVNRILKRPWQIQLVATLATSIVLINFVIVAVGSVPKTVYSDVTTMVWTFGGQTVSVQRLVVIGATVVTFAILAWFLRSTRHGRSMRALSQNREAATVVGLPVRRIGLSAVIIAAGMAGVASAIIVPLYSASPTMGALTALTAFAAVIMGGFGNVTGAVISGFVLGLVQAFAIGFVSSEYASGVVFAVMILVLLFRPQGLFGRVVRA